MVLGDILMADADHKPWVANNIEIAEKLHSRNTLLQLVQDIERYYDTTNVYGHLSVPRKSHALLGQVTEGTNQHLGYTPQLDYNPTPSESGDLDACLEAFNAYTFNYGNKPFTIPHEVYRQMAMYSPAGLALLLADREAY
jgi:hypothetical protein